MKYIDFGLVGMFIFLILISFLNMKTSPTLMNVLIPILLVSVGSHMVGGYNLATIIPSPNVFHNGVIINNSPYIPFMAVIYSLIANEIVPYLTVLVNSVKTYVILILVTLGIISSKQNAPVLTIPNVNAIPKVVPGINSVKTDPSQNVSGPLVKLPIHSSTITVPLNPFGIISFYAS